MHRHSAVPALPGQVLPPLHPHCTKFTSCPAPVPLGAPRGTPGSPAQGHLSAGHPGTRRTPSPLQVTASHRQLGTAGIKSAVISLQTLQE